MEEHRSGKGGGAHRPDSVSLSLSGSTGDPLPEPAPPMCNVVSARLDRR